ncbi:flavodoxin family protein [Nocardioides sp. Y6]|uniref:Flavodoxin family protein n=1 Tax=Nocardioides malaquae TaxID=2773426 RepID=A0ABR9RVV5_9ACTN|nr:flavodoxin family protein [Nocardioides malaquae]MBE7325733.1 flavodoxin family protein [Nocardioides malaquae]
MRTWVVVESMWGNTRQGARAVAEGLGEDAQVLDVAQAPRLTGDVDLLVIGGPTHAFSMSRASTRPDAVRQGGAATAEATGIREWLAAQERAPQLAVATFDTRVASMRRLPGSAARAAARAAGRRHLGHVVGRESFYVTGVSGPLADGEVDRAREWGRTLRNAR